MDQSWPLLVYFCSFLITISIIQIKKHRWYAWDLNQGLQNGRRRQNHRAMELKIFFEILASRC